MPHPRSVGSCPLRFAFAVHWWYPGCLGGDPGARVGDSMACAGRGAAARRTRSRETSGDARRTVCGQHAVVQCGGRDCRRHSVGRRTRGRRVRTAVSLRTGPGCLPGDAGTGPSQFRVAQGTSAACQAVYLARAGALLGRCGGGPAVGHPLAVPSDVPMPCAACHEAIYRCPLRRHARQVPGVTR